METTTKNGDEKLVEAASIAMVGNLNLDGAVRVTKRAMARDQGANEALERFRRGEPEPRSKGFNAFLYLVSIFGGYATYGFFAEVGLAAGLIAFFFWCPTHFLAARIGAVMQSDWPAKIANLYWYALGVIGFMGMLDDFKVI